MNVFDTLAPLAASHLRASELALFVQPYWDRLVGKRYSTRTVRGYVHCLAHFAHWSARRQMRLSALDRYAERFVEQHLSRCTCDAPVQRSRHQAHAALEHLRAVVRIAGVQFDVRPRSVPDEQLHRFDRYLQDVRGLAASTRLRRSTILRPLVAVAVGTGLPSADQLRRFLNREVSRVSAASAGATTTAVRSYLRFCAFEGHRVEHLLPIVASPANWRLAPLPQTLTRDGLDRLLDAFPSNLPSRRRCYAVVRCVVDLGLRCSEVVGLEFEHIDWAAGTVRISKTKSRRVDVLPLPQTTGQAIAEYIRSERPQTASRRIFVRHVAPRDEPVTAGVVRRAVLEAYRRAGLAHTRVHILRHTLASRLLNAGGTLKEVADLLRHRELDTSLIYAKVDLVRLKAVVMPWPGSDA